MYRSDFSGSILIATVEYSTIVDMPDQEDTNHDGLLTNLGNL
jgi:hypothetical protein